MHQSEWLKLAGTLQPRQWERWSAHITTPHQQAPCLVHTSSCTNIKKSSATSLKAVQAASHHQKANANNDYVADLN